MVDNIDRFRRSQVPVNERFNSAERRSATAITIRVH
jgi:hypothetical protein